MTDYPAPPVRAKTPDIKAIYEPKGLRFYDAASGRDMLLVEEPSHVFNGWLCFRHPDGQWVSLRKATDNDLWTLKVARAFNEGENRYRQTVLSQEPLPGYPKVNRDDRP